MKERIEVISDTFLIAETANEEICGYIVGPAITERYLSDDLFEKTIPNPANAAFQSVLSLAVHEKFRGLGIASQLLTELARVSAGQKRSAITLTCLAELIPFYERNHYRNEGKSNSAHAGETWYNLVCELPKNRGAL